MNIFDKLEVAIEYNYTLLYCGGHPDFPKDTKMSVSLKKNTIILQKGTLVPHKEIISFDEIQQIRLEDKYNEKYLMLDLEKKGVPFSISFTGKKAQEAYSILIKKYMAFK